MSSSSDTGEPEALEAPEEAAGRGQDGAPARVHLVTIHGTAAGAETAAGDRWWQLGSAFLEQLGERLDLDPQRVEITPFQWGEGPNSEQGRRDASRRLYDQLAAYEDAGEDYCLIGHSHGGSVAYGALLESVRSGRVLERLRCWCTVGTPFLDYRANALLFQRLQRVGLAIYTSGLVLLLLGLLTWAFAGLSPDLAAANAKVLRAFAFALLISGGFSTLATFFLERRRHKTWFTRKQKRQAASTYSASWLGLWHLEDEAISALSNIQHTSAPIIPNNFLEPFVSALQLAMVIVPGLVGLYDLLWNQGDWLLGITRWILEGDEQNLPFDEWVAGLVGVVVVFGAVFFVLMWILGGVLRLMARALGLPLAWMLNRLVWLSVRRRAWGDDLLKEDVKAIAAQPPEFSEGFAFLPEPVAQPLREHSESHAIVTLHKVREVLGMTQGSQVSADLRSELSESLQWNELIHTSYFDVPAFVDLLALGLHRAGLGERREGFGLTAECQELLDWLSRNPAPSS